MRDLIGDEAEELLQHRFAINNVRRPIVGPLRRSPLALCDAGTLETENLVASELRYPDRTGETYAVTYSPNQRWYYFPRMQPDEALLIRCFDSARSGPARFSAHGAFEDTQTPADPPPRESSEVRTQVFFVGRKIVRFQNMARAVSRLPRRDQRARASEPRTIRLMSGAGSSKPEISPTAPPARH